eukprot:gene8132-12505_t
MGTERRRGFVVSVAACLGLVTTLSALHYDYSERGQHIHDDAAVDYDAVPPSSSPLPGASSKERLPLNAHTGSTFELGNKLGVTPLSVPARLAKVLGKQHTAQLEPGDELLAAANQTLDFLDKYETLGDPQLPKEDLQQALRDRGFGKIDGLLSRPVAADLRQFVLSLLNAEGVTWKPNEGDEPHKGALGRACYGLAPKFYAPLEKIMKESRIVEYMAALMPGICPGLQEKQFRMTQLFITVNDRIKWHVDYPSQPPFSDGKTTMYTPDFCQFKTLFYLQDHGSEGDGNPSALMVVPKTHKSEPWMTRCGPHNCSIARKGLDLCRGIGKVITLPRLVDC